MTNIIQIIAVYLVITVIACLVLVIVIANGVYLGIRWAKEKEYRDHLKTQNNSK